MSSSDPSSLAKKSGPSRARKATFLLLIPYCIGALGAWFGFPLNWNMFGVKCVLILAPPIFAISKFPIISAEANDKWQWSHFFLTAVYLILASWLMFHQHALVGCDRGVCF